MLVMKHEMTPWFSSQICKHVLLLTCFLFLNTFGWGQTQILDRSIQVPEYSGTAKGLLEQIHQQENIVFAYSSEVSLDYKVKFKKEKMTLSAFLKEVFKGKPVAYKVSGEKVLLFPKKITYQAPKPLTQTVRGTLVDADSRMPLIGAAVVIAESNPAVGTSTDMDGRFRLEDVPVGRIDLQLYYLGYEPRIVANLEVNSGKEVVLELTMQQSILEMEEVVVTGGEEKGEAMNEMALNSARSISPEESKRFAGPFNDPSRIVSNYAGVANSQDGSNDIIIRGNSPKYMQWRFEGVQITNPNHFADQNGVGAGGISALNNNLLSTSDFYTGAFTPEYGDVLSGVYDVKLRAGNNEKRETVFGLGIMGTDLTLEGPFKKGYGGSYLVNYRYSTVSFIRELGLVDVEGVPKYQDATFKIVLPSKKMGTFSLFGLAGASGFEVENVDDADWTPGSGNRTSALLRDHESGAYLFNTGLNHIINVSPKGYLKTTLSYSLDGIDDKVFEADSFGLYDATGQFLRDSISQKRLGFHSELQKTAYRGAATYHHKINARHNIQIGTQYTLFDYVYRQSEWQQQNSSRFTLIDFDEQVGTLRNFVSWRYRLSEAVTVVSGLHNMNVLYNNKSFLEPRFAVKWQINGSNSINAGYGKHSTMESIHNYFAKVELPNGEIAEPNQDLDLLKAHHFVLGYQKRFSKNLLVKAEVYYQDLYDLPVENNDTSFYATINESNDFRYVDLVNEGTGKNYGVEVTVERFFSNQYYFLINGSVYDSKYTSLEGVERNTLYNGNYLVNLLCGKEFDNLGKKQNQTLGLNVKAFFGGSRRYIPLLRDQEGNLAVDPANDRYWDYEKAYEDKIEDLYQVSLSTSYKFNKPKTTHEIFLNLDNLTDNQGKLAEYYDENEPNGVGYSTQFGFFPNLMYRVYF